MAIEQEFSKILRDWYRKNGRELPWRGTKNAYKIWLSEVILQQTRVDQGLPYYLRFIEEFPRIQDLAGAPIDKVLKLWQGLGYYSRARNLHAAAKQVTDLFEGEFPADYHQIRSLKGIGDYTAAAISSFAFDLPHPVVDGNVYRFLSRFTGNDTPIDSTAGKKIFAQLAAELLDPAHPAEHNQAIMEFGALQCRPVNPGCESCPFQFACEALIQNIVDQLPVKEKKQKVRDRYFHYYYIHDGQYLLLRKREAKDIWQGLYEFPLVEIEGGHPTDHLKELGFTATEYKVSKPVSITHLLSHQRLHTLIREIRCSNARLPGYIRVAEDELHRYGLPQLLVKYMTERS